MSRFRPLGHRLSITSVPERAADLLAPVMARLAKGERAALRELYMATNAKLFAVCLRILSDRGECEDVLQDVYVTVWRRAEAFDPARASTLAWLSAVARNRAIDKLRSRRSRLGHTTLDGVEIADPAPRADADWERSMERRRLDACLDGLRAEESGAIRTAFLEGVTYEALAARAGVPLGTMKSWVRRGLLRLRECLEG